jgi:hypothetical protein
MLAIAFVLIVEARDSCERVVSDLADEGPPSGWPSLIALES